MQKYKTLFIFLALTAIWAAFFSSVKFFLWGDLQTTLKPDLQSIAGYLSFGGIFAYIVWGACASTFLKKYYLFVISFLSLFFVIIAYIFGFSSHIGLAGIVIILGFLYGLWSVVKNVLIAIEIEKTGMQDTTLNAIVGIIFVVFVIAGTLLWSMLFENLWKNGYFVIMAMLASTWVLSLQMNYDKKSFKELISWGLKKYYHERKKSLSTALRNYIPDLKYIIKHYSPIMFASAFLWSISTVVSQSSMEYSIAAFSIEASSAAYIFLYSAVWAIAWNIVSMRMWKRRWLYWLVFSNIFAFLIFLFPFLAISFWYMSILACMLGIFFGISSNLVDAFFVKIIGEEDKKEYGSSTYGFILSIVLFSTMFLSSAIQWLLWYMYLMMILALIMLLVSWSLYIKQK